MGSDPRSPKARHRFGFFGPPTRETKDKVTTDDILDSLTRQAELRQNLGEKAQVRLEEIAEMEDLSRFQGFNPEPVSPPIGGTRSVGHLVFILMLACGLTIVWLYSSISKPFDLASLAKIIQKSGVQSIFTNPVQFGIIALSALLGTLWIRLKRRGSSLRLRSH